MKFSIRDLLLVTVIVALALGWGVDHWKKAEENDLLTKAERRYSLLRDLVESDGSQVILSEDEDAELRVGIVRPSPNGPPATSTSTAKPPGE